MTRKQPDLAAIHASVALVGRLTDGIIRLGPFRFGLDAAFSWIPGIAEIYSGAAATFLIVQGLRAKVPLSTLGIAAALMGGRTIITAIPLAGPAAADLMALHGFSARLIARAIERRMEAMGGAVPPGHGPGWRTVTAAA